MKLSKKGLVWVLMALVMFAGMAIAACSSPQAVEEPTTEGSASKPEIVPPTPNEFGVITADMWKDAYPDEYASYQHNADNTARTDYVADNPYIVTLYDGGGFAKSYDSAIGHVYTLDDVAATGRPHKTANCLTCKSPEMTALVNRDGDSVYAQPFEDVYATLDEPVSCYNCHENTGDQLVVTHSYLKNALGDDLSKVAPENAACGQCHNEYYFNGETKATTLPWSGLDQMTPERMLAYYNDLGFVDMTNTISGTEMLKVQHPEFETVLGAGNKMQSMGNLTCASCHMGETTNDAGESYVSHNWVSPLKNAELIENSCKSCHADLSAEIAALQQMTTERENVIGAKLADLHTKIGAAAADGSKTEAELAELRSAVRDAQFYWDFVFVENSEGAHNSTLTKQLLDKAESMVDGALAKF
jgi:nitrite reductase (cytochrome c-552)